MVDFKQQKPGTNTCGQTCVAMIIGCHVDKVKIIMGKGGSTRSSDLRKALSHYGYHTTPKLARMSPALLAALIEANYTDQVFILNLRSNLHKNRGHWVVCSGKYIYDPAKNDKRRIRPYIKRLHNDEWRITSYMVVVEPVVLPS